MSDKKKSEFFDEAIVLLTRCRRFAELSVWDTPRRRKLLDDIEEFEQRLTDHLTEE